MLGLHVRRLIGNERIGGGMGLIEAVASKLINLIKNLGRLAFRHALIHGTYDEGLALLVHLGLDFFSHCAAQYISVTERVTREFLSNLHHLFLINYDAEGLLEDTFKGRI